MTLKKAGLYLLKLLPGVTAIVVELLSGNSKAFGSIPNTFQSINDPCINTFKKFLVSLVLIKN